MADKIYDVGRFRHSIDNWQLSMLLGIIFFIVGIVVFFEPGGTYLALSVLFGIVVILSGAWVRRLPPGRAWDGTSQAV